MTAHARPNRGSLAENLIDLLDIDGGWWTAEAIAGRLNAKTNTVQKAVQRATEAGWVTKRATGHNHQVEYAVRSEAA